MFKIVKRGDTVLLVKSFVKLRLKYETTKQLNNTEFYAFKAEILI